MKREEERLSLLFFTWSERGYKSEAVEDGTRAMLLPLEGRYG
jgi:hypothetical protein